MMRLVSLFMCLWLAIVPARAKEAPIDPTQSYAVIEIRKLESPMVKGANMPGSVTLTRYDRAKGDIRPAIGADVIRIVVEKKPLAKTKEGRLYLVRLVPDDWVVEGSNGTAFSLGSMMFSVAPGEVVDLGVFTPSVDWLEGEGPKGIGSAILGAALFGSMRPKDERPVRIDWHARTSADMPLPGSLTGRTVVPARFDPDHKFGNHLGGLVNRFGGRASRPQGKDGGGN